MCNEEHCLSLMGIRIDCKRTTEPCKCRKINLGACKGLRHKRRAPEAVLADRVSLESSVLYDWCFVHAPMYLLLLRYPLLHRYRNAILVSNSGRTVNLVSSMCKVR